MTSQARAFGRRIVAETMTQEPALPPASVPAQPNDYKAPDAAKPPPLPTVTPVAALRQACLARLDPATIAGVPAEKVQVEVERLLSEIADENRIHLNAREQRSLAVELVDDMLGLGPLEPLLDDETVNEVMVNGPDRVFVEQRGRLALTTVKFRDANHLSNVAQRIAARVGRRVDESSPMADARLLDGSRVNIVFPPLALNGGPCITIRKFPKRKTSLAELVSRGSMISQMARVLEIAAQCRLNVLISGGTGSGKTTMMNAMSRMIDPGMRVITIEDAAELQLQQPHVIRLETRPPNLEGRGEVTQRDLVKNALRMRPDILIIGECRGAEAFDMLQAMNTGHDGSMSTVHANNTRDAITRIENMVQMGQPNLPLRAIRTQIVSAVDVIVQLERMRDGVRRCTQITEVMGMEGDVITLNDVFRFEYDGETADGTLRGRYYCSRVRPGFLPRLAYYNLEQAWLAAIAEAPG